MIHPKKAPKICYIYVIVTPPTSQLTALAPHATKQLSHNLQSTEYTTYKLSHGNFYIASYISRWPFLIILRTVRSNGQYKVTKGRYKVTEGWCKMTESWYKVAEGWHKWPRADMKWPRADKEWLRADIRSHIKMPCHHFYILCL